MDDKEKEKLLEWYEGCDSDVPSSEHDPFSTDEDSDFEVHASELLENSSSYGSDDSDLQIGRGQNNQATTSTTPCHSRDNIEGRPANQIISDSDSHIEDETNEDETSAINNFIWESTMKDPIDLMFDDSKSGIRRNIENLKPIQVFDLVWTRDIMTMLLEKTNEYGQALYLKNRPKRRNERFKTFTPISLEELKKFIGLCLLGGQLKFRSVRSLFSLDPLYYHPIFSASMSGRRFEQILRCLNCSDEDDNDGLGKVNLLLKKVIKNSQGIFYPKEALSLDESLLLFRGRLRFRVYIKNKKSKYGIKFYELCSSDGVVLNIEIYKGKTNRDDVQTSKVDYLVLRLMEPYLNKGHHLFMDNFYNSIGLSNKLLNKRTHTTGTLRSNRSGNPKEVTTAKLKRDEHVWRRSKNIYVSKWRDKRDVLTISTAYTPQMVEVDIRYGKKRKTPLDVAKYNENMSGVDRSDQMISYYSCPIKTVRWYKKVIFHLLDIAMWNAFYIYKYNLDKKPSYSNFREEVIRELLGIVGKGENSWPRYQ